MGDFEIYAAPLDGVVDVVWHLQLANDVAVALAASGAVKIDDNYQVRTDSAIVTVMMLPPGGEWVWPVFESHSLLVDVRFRREVVEWSDAEGLARYVFRQLRVTTKYELLLVCDVEGYVDSNFEFPERSSMIKRRPS
ncbi:hypothetical protein [Streptomyces sp. BK79]|uniref:hypothetical protein n=1 Tax=Streptomyces sp. BK79 TaxID=3350097 RepID=UPI0037703976